MALVPFSQDFEGLNQADPAALANDGWLVFGNVFDPGGGYLYGYGVFGAPNGGPAFSGITTGEGGPDQGAQQLVTYNDYNSDEHIAGNLVEANCFQEFSIGAGDVSETWVFTFDAKLGDILPPTTALAFIKTLDPNAGWATTNFITVDMTSIPATWGTYSISITIDPSLNGQILQIGFANTTTNYTPSGIIYDNINFASSGPVATEEMSFGGVKSLFR
jgi:hypothetical protein